MKDFYLLIDDVRGVDHVGEVDLIARTASDGRDALLNNQVTHLYIDNDLGSDQDMEGIQILEWARDNNCVPGHVSIVSSNPPAKRRMEAVLFFDLGYTYHSSTGWWY